MSTSLRSQAAIVAMARVVASALAIAVPVFLARRLTQGEFGHYKSYFLVATTIGSLASFALPNSLYYFIPRSMERTSAYLTQSLALLCGTGVLASVLVFLFRARLAAYLQLQDPSDILPLMLMVGLLPAAALNTIIPILARDARMAALILVGTEFAKNALIVLAAALTGSAATIVLAVCLVYGFQIAMVARSTFVSRREQHQQPTKETLKEQVHYSSRLAGTSYLGLARNQLHGLLMAGRLAPSEFAIYAVGTLYVPMVDQVTHTMGEYVVLENSSHNASGRVEAMRYMWFRAAEVIVLLLVPIFVVLEVFARDIIVVLYGAKYQDAATIFRIYLLVLPLEIIGLAAPQLRATAQLGRMLAADTISLAITVAFLWILLPHYGPLAAVGSLVVGTFAYDVVAIRGVSKPLQRPVLALIPWKILTRVGLTALVASAAGYMLFAQSTPGVRLWIGGGLAGLLYLAAAWRLKLIPENDIAWGLAALRRFRDRFRSAPDAP